MPDRAKKSKERACIDITMMEGGMPTGEDACCMELKGTSLSVGMEVSMESKVAQGLEMLSDPPSDLSFVIKGSFG